MNKKSLQKLLLFPYSLGVFNFIVLITFNSSCILFCKSCCLYQYNM